MEDKQGKRSVVCQKKERKYAREVEIRRRMIRKRGTKEKLIFIFSPKKSSVNSKTIPGYLRVERQQIICWQPLLRIDSNNLYPN
jgi:hypothetical protein